MEGMQIIVPERTEEDIVLTALDVLPANEVESAEVASMTKKEEDELYQQGLADYNFRVKEGEGDEATFTYPKRSTIAAQYFIKWTRTQ